MLARLLLSVRKPALGQRLEGLTQGPHVRVVHGDPQQPLAERLAEEPFELAIIDGFYPPESATEQMERVQSLPDRPQVVMVRGTTTASGHAHYLAMGVLAVLDETLSDEELANALGAVIEHRRAERVDRTRKSRARHQGIVPPLICESQVMRDAVRLAQRLATADTPALLLGETGVGKERFARLLHDEGSRAAGPFVAVNCAAIPTELFESEVFGHVKGAFTGAHAARRGYFELAGRGSIFLDEIGEVPLPQQAKLLRVLQESVMTPVGAERSVPVDVRIIAATNRDLSEDIQFGRFRKDLYYRLGVVELRIPPLRERREDIPKLADTYRHEFASVLARDVEGFTEAAYRALSHYDWPGNVRELVNVVERAVLLCRHSRIDVLDLPESLARPMVNLPDAMDATPLGTLPEPLVGLLTRDWASMNWKQARAQLLESGEKFYLESILDSTRGQVGLAATRAGISARALFEKMRRHNLRKESFRGPREPDDKV